VLSIKHNFSVPSSIVMVSSQYSYHKYPSTQHWYHSFPACKT